MISFHGNFFLLPICHGFTCFLEKTVGHTQWKSSSRLLKSPSSRVQELEPLGKHWETCWGRMSDPKCGRLPKIMTDLCFWWKRHRWKQFRVFGKCLRKWHRNTSNISFDARKKEKGKNWRPSQLLQKRFIGIFFLWKFRWKDLWIGSAIGSQHPNCFFSMPRTIPKTKRTACV